MLTLYINLMAVYMLNNYSFKMGLTYKGITWKTEKGIKARSPMNLSMFDYLNSNQ